MEPFDGKKNFGYEYPRGLDLRPGSEFHKKIVDDVRRCADAARAASAKARTEWRKTDNLLQAYVPLATNERPAENNADAPTTIIVPQSQAQLSIHLAHMAGRFIDSTLYEFEGDAGVQSMLNAAKLERVIGKQARWFKHSLRHMISFRDGFAYGVGAVAPRWALVQAGYRNRFGHPAPPVAARYAARGLTLVESAGCGAATWSSASPDALRCERMAAPRYWQHRMAAAPTP